MLSKGAKNGCLIVLFEKFPKNMKRIQLLLSLSLFFIGTFREKEKIVRKVNALFSNLMFSEKLFLSRVVIRSARLFSFIVICLFVLPAHNLPMCLPGQHMCTFSITFFVSDLDLNFLIQIFSLVIE